MWERQQVSHRDKSLYGYEVILQQTDSLSFVKLLLLRSFGCCRGFVVKYFDEGIVIKDD